MSNSPSFPNMPTDSSLPEIGMYNPGNVAPMEQGQFTGGSTKIQPSATAPHAGEQVGYGYMSPELKDVGFAPSGENSSGIPAAQPIDPLTFGDPNDTAMDFKDGQGINTYNLTGKDYEKHGFETPVA